MSTPILSKPIKPKRKRGYDRVDSIIDAATELFAAKGYTSVTMTEIAERSSTAIGSLYRFFPSKEALLAAMLERYGDFLSDEMAEIARRTSVATMPECAKSLVQMMRSLRKERASVLAMLDAQEQPAVFRSGIRQRMLRGLSEILSRISNEGMDNAVHPRAWVLLYALKGVRQLDQDKPELRDETEEDAFRLIESYLHWVAHSSSEVLPRPNANNVKQKGAVSEKADRDS